MNIVAKCDNVEQPWEYWDAYNGISFINCYWDKVAVEQLPNEYQIAIRKL